MLIYLQVHLVQVIFDPQKHAAEWLTERGETWEEELGDHLMRLQAAAAAE